jgi:serine protease Do
MAKSPARSEAPPPRVAAPPDPRLGFAHGALKLGAFVLGLPAALLCGMALVGALTGNGFVRVIVAVVVVVGVPLVIADRLLPSEPTRARGLVSDVCAVTWMLLTFGLAAAAGTVTRPLLTTEGDRLVAEGHEDIAKGAFFLAGLRVEPVAVPEPAASGSAATSDSAAPAGDGGAAPLTSATADAGAHRPKPDKAADRTPADLFKEVSPSVVTISVHTNQYDGGGTGFLIDKDGTIATNHHVIDGALRVQVKFLNGSVF